MPRFIPAPTAWLICPSIPYARAWAEAELDWRCLHHTLAIFQAPADRQVKIIRPTEVNGLAPHSRVYLLDLGDAPWRVDHRLAFAIIAQELQLQIIEHWRS